MTSAIGVRVRDDIDLRADTVTGSTVRLNSTDDIRAYARELATSALGSTRHVEQTSEELKKDPSDQPQGK